jgi:hypothetical protein
LTDTGGEQAAAVFIIDKSAGQAYGELIGIVQSVVSGETGFPE